ncbi:MAG: hypothetical protein NPIRA01_04330 [Nitrospirales bacterium]|nr:MAG: hypothetical protein NPIRA01_04330 [Nitrospirales bacterium]
MPKQQLFKNRNRDEEAPGPTQGSQEKPEGDDLQVCIAHRAYELYEQEGCCHGHDFDHWLQAEREVLSAKPEK